MVLPHDGSTISPLATAIAAIVMGLGIAFTGLRSYFKERKEPSAGKEVVLASATFADRRTVEKLVDALDRLEGAFSRNVESNHEVADEVRKLRRSMDDTTEAVRSSTDTIVNLAAWLKARPSGG